MPVYTFKCKKCGKEKDYLLKIGETPEPCCGEEMVRSWQPTPIIFKGDGFYKTDNRTDPSTQSKGIKDVKE